MNRRRVLRTVGGAGSVGVAGLAGCLFADDSDEPNEDDEEPEDPNHDETLRVVTYRSMVSGPNPPGPWLVEAFEEEYPDAELEWVVPEAGVEHYLQRGEYGGEIDADVCFGFTVGDLTRIDDRIEEGGLLRELNHDRIDGVDRIQDGLDLEDPHGRALAYDAGYVSLVYDDTVLEPPEAFADLVESEYADTLLTHHPGYSMPGQAFLLWTIATGGPSDAMNYWEELAANGARIHRSWSASYDAYLDAERPLVVSYSTDPVFAAREGYDERRHRVAFLEDEGYTLPEGMGIFEAATAPDLAYAFLEFVLTDEVQAELARRNVQIPAVEGVDPGLGFVGLAREPPEPVATSYTELRGELTEWLTEWADRFDEHLVEERPPTE
ncbi:thiamine ABC transporter substrate-binding protein [Natronolimnohabitans innermongolicus]|uniref:ABC transporter substrate-binding protein n=1 Tax=Natronolimnohabitans innermongolicus JCM 12255 TaxID=1227499 RepID=L9X3G9_9EURY|nr:thiamine ABC transporter substrate-binding protein [Natronolimnohabitans innermongolicus]ELY55123.1 ABC transporter substrate-binding protein [Natronolimnohabitans innermongolicus JCM 12255]